MSITPVKSSVNILQEYGTSKYRTLPHYTVKDVSPSIHNPKFQVSVELGKIYCTAEACNKKQAKEMCSRMALDELGLTQHSVPLTTTANIEIDETDSTEDIVNFNAVGVLNEYASKNRLPYAGYNDVGTNERGLMIIECSLGKMSAHGLGVNKKAAKKVAAAALLKKLKSTKLVCPSPQAALTTASFIKSEDIVRESTEESGAILPVQKSDENLVEDKAAENKRVDHNTEVLKDSEVKKDEKADKEEAMLEDFRLKLSKLGITDDNHLVVSKNVNSCVLFYKNDDLHINIVKISYDLDQSLTDIYENIKERVEE